MSKMQNYLLVDGETGEKSYGALPVGEALPLGAIAVDRQPAGEFEAHCEKSGRILRDHAGLADLKAGPAAIAAAHAAKVLEARLFLAGVDVSGVVSAEAQALKIPLADLAAAIVAKAQPSVEAEVARRVEKAKGIK